MFWGCVPIATAVSCVPYMLDYGKEVSIRFGFRKRRKCNGASSCFLHAKDLETMQVDGLENILWNILKLKLNPIAPMRILQLIDSLEAGGAERMAVNYIML
jgi:hypothetical protein